mmetsp:Transcript_20445/g.31224  ORF Transcript_20445/g.31224 Transcript_20445/m.31224 type:complete len:350 (-) Transcript_20445:837-1886(-)|eukprot:CAMPEP_0197324078 /NCGR_PEP_ID=MMETSP0891-20130614/70895_1 /TAXON_ID=44058 ORGANISM="Aureoumbra lagunensis, Strain CCMP1510" /NCGR_SAMPLE_ID=MMETSP0891 /ASSEMBLY_ACC=CAM_ASM_000534 /LENGTH=349 /DNA_ID=CAMNT_0042816835 /DNA_START=3404 /DNA_END=4453 /DNA_ORIENTATION=-
MFGQTPKEASPRTKLEIAFGSLIIAIIGLTVPTRLKLGPRLTACANLFTGGLILSTSLVHLLADSTESDGDGFPWACMLLGVGYGLLMSVDTIAAANPPESITTKNNFTADEERERLTSTLSVQIKAHEHRPDSGFVATLALIIHGIGDGLAVALQRSEHRLVAVSGAILLHKFFASYALGTLLTTLPNTSKPTTSSFLPREEQRCSHTTGVPIPNYRRSTAAGLPLAESSSAPDGNYTHSSMTNDNDENDFFKWWRRPLYAAIFAISTPLAICAVVLGDSSSARFAATVQNSGFVDRTTSLCAGSLLYISINEILPSALDTPAIPSACTKLAFFWFGFIVMSILALWT